MGSTSARRKEILCKALNLGDCEVIDSKIDEREILGLSKVSPATYVLTIGNAKADAILEQICPSDAIVFAGDQVVVCNGLILEKPKSKDEIYKNYKMFKEFGVTTVGSVIAYDCSSSFRACFVEETNFGQVELSDWLEFPFEEAMNTAGGLLLELCTNVPSDKLESGLAWSGRLVKNAMVSASSVVATKHDYKSSDHVGGGSSSAK